MERMLAVMADNPVAAAAGLIAMVCLAAWPLFRTRRAMLLAYIGNNLAFVVHYALLDHWTAVAMNGLMGVQTVVAIMLVRLPKLRWAYYALMPVLALASLATWQGLPSFLSAAATTLSTIGRMQTNETTLRLLLLPRRRSGRRMTWSSVPCQDLLPMFSAWRRARRCWCDAHRRSVSVYSARSTRCADLSYGLVCSGGRSQNDTKKALTKGERFQP